MKLWTKNEILSGELEKVEDHQKKFVLIVVSSEVLLMFESDIFVTTLSDLQQQTSLDTKSD